MVLVKCPFGQIIETKSTTIVEPVEDPTKKPTTTTVTREYGLDDHYHKVDPSNKTSSSVIMHFAPEDEDGKKTAENANKSQKMLQLGKRDVPLKGIHKVFCTVEDRFFLIEEENGEYITTVMDKRFEALEEVGVDLIKNSLAKGNDFLKYIIAQVIAIIPLYIAIVEFVIPETEIYQQLFFLLPLALFAFSGWVAFVAIIPDISELDTNDPEKVNEFQEGVLKQYRKGAIISATLLYAGIVLAGLTFFV